MSNLHDKKCLDNAKLFALYIPQGQLVSSKVVNVTSHVILPVYGLRKQCHLLEGSNSGPGNYLVSACYCGRWVMHTHLVYKLSIVRLLIQLKKSSNSILVEWLKITPSLNNVHIPC